MTFEPYRGPNRPRRFRTYDLEWYPETYQLRLVGTYDGARYRSYTSIADFLDSEIEYSSSGTTWFAHAGGLCDVQFVLAELLAKPRNYEIQVVFSGASAIRVTLLDARAKRAWTFADSYWLLRDKLSAIGQSIGLAKKGEDYRCVGDCGHPPGHCIFYAPQAVLEDYNHRDCQVLYDAIARLETELLELGGSLRNTIGSCAMRLFRSAYMTTPIETNETVNAIARQAYIASRVEVIRPKAHNARVYDVNSSFPHSMCASLPGTDRRMRLDATNPWPDNGRPVLCDASVRVGDEYLPPLPWRNHDGRIYFPTGSWRAWFTDLDLRALEEQGGQILASHGWIEFDPWEDMAAYSQDIYNRRKHETDPFRRLVLKYLANSLYGKCGERSDKEQFTINPSSTDGLTEVCPGIWSGESNYEISHCHVPISAYITARSRHLLGSYLNMALETGDVFYCDTDSVVTNSILPTSTDLGELKLELEMGPEDIGVFIAPKFYRIGNKIKSKGFSRLDLDAFETLVGQLQQPRDQRIGIPIRRMARLREGLKTGKINPRDIEMHKALRMAFPKRAPCGDNDTRPWAIEELL